MRMLDTPFEQISSVIVWISCLFAIWRGGRPERVAACAMILAWAGTVLLEDRTDWISPQYAMMCVDGALLVALGTMAVTWSRRWLVFAAAAQFLLVASHLAMILDLRLLSVAYLTSIAIWSLAVLIAMIVGTLTEAAAERRRLRGLSGSPVTGG
jgi:hypothetical protein